MSTIVEYNIFFDIECNAHILCDECRTYIQHLTKDYIWQKESFLLQVEDRSGINFTDLFVY